MTIVVLIFTAQVRVDGGCPATRPSDIQGPRVDPDENPSGVIDWLEQVADVEAWSSGTMVNANVMPTKPVGVELGYRQSQYPRIGSWTSPPVSSTFPFTAMLASFNVNTPGAAGASLEIRVEQHGIWSPWVYMQSWGKTLTPPNRTTRWSDGHADIDTLLLDHAATKYQSRVTLFSFEYDGNAPKPTIRRLSVCYTGVVTGAGERARIIRKLRGPSTRPETEWARDLQVPYRAQGSDDIPKALQSLVCSPTSTSMVLQYYGVNRPTLDNASAIYDPFYDLFGNWGRAISRAGDFGLDAYLTRIRNWDQVHDMIARGVPVIASIRFNRGEVKGFLYESTKGHLIVIRGFKPNGDVIVNDPARKERGNGVIYKPDQFAKAWFDHGGVAYVIERPSESRPTTSPSIAQN